MAIMVAILALLAAVVASSVIARAAAPILPLPLPFVQTALGGLIGACCKLQVAIEPQSFLLVFVAPLLFLDAAAARVGSLDEEDSARLAAARAAIGVTESNLRTITEAQPDAELHRQAGTLIIERYRRRIEARSRAEVAVAQRLDAIERATRMAALKAERDEYYRIARSGRLSDELVRGPVREIDLQEFRLTIGTRLA